ncbi:MAG TPA: UbiA family prenyltransferase [Gemmataceae bacterium]|jgi:4-hydroxybenzoate polyprenyltransferase|nr:UbiA family prenyltransferase [Gemmataceae bacterium]
MRFLPYARLLRLPNVFTAFADILLGTIAAATWRTNPAGAALLLLASGCLYCAGMVWNDYCDFEEDKRERPFRPLPAGQISRSSAFRLGSALLGTGIALAVAAGFTFETFTPWPAILAATIAIAVLLYDAWLKRTRIGPLAMAACRFLNVLLGLSLASVADVPWTLRLHLATAVGLYIVSVTWFARQEAGRSQPAQLIGASVFVVLALLLALVMPVYQPPGSVIPIYPYLLVAFGFYLGLAAYRAIRQPEPKHVQAAVKRAILGLVMLDAILCTPEAGWWGLLIMLLLPPALLLGKWVYST